ncbi:MAG: hypothetical protein H0Z32_13955 [Bacillaceae bacterium]|nr:hypothetical protein [Bacillaceae bacterium]
MKKLFMFITVLGILLGGCGTDHGGSPESDLSGMYISAFEELIQQDSGLNYPMNFISFDFTELELSQAEKERIMDYFEAEYEAEIMEKDLEQLQDEGYFNKEKLMLEEGFLLSIKKVEKLSKGHYKVEGEKYRSGLGAIGLAIEVQKNNGSWEVSDSTYLWIS